MEWPLAYLITFRTYGTWLPGDERGYVDAQHSSWAEPYRMPDPDREDEMRGLMRHPSVLLTDVQRRSVLEAIHERCLHTGWQVMAANVRTNHVHVVLTAAERPEPVMDSLKRWATRRLRQADPALHDRRVWARHGSTRHLWKDDAVARAVEYVLEQQ